MLVGVHRFGLLFGFLTGKEGCVARCFIIVSFRFSPLKLFHSQRNVFLGFQNYLLVTNFISLVTLIILLVRITLFPFLLSPVILWMIKRITTWFQTFLLPRLALMNGIYLNYQVSLSSFLFLCSLIWQFIKGFLLLLLAYLSWYHMFYT